MTSVIKKSFKDKFKDGRVVIERKTTYRSKNKKLAEDREAKAWKSKGRKR